MPPQVRVIAAAMAFLKDYFEAFFLRQRISLSSNGVF